MEAQAASKPGCSRKLFVGLVAGALFLMGVGITILVLATGPGKAPPHPFDSFTRADEIGEKVFSGKGDSTYFDHIWILSSPDLNAWWEPNGMRAEAELIVDSDNPELIHDAVSTAGSGAATDNQVRTLKEGRIYHVLLFNTRRAEYVHLRFSYRSEQKDGSVVFQGVTASTARPL